MRKTYNYRSYLTKGQRRLLEQQLELCRWVYNETPAERKRAYEERGARLRLYDTQAMLPVWKMTRPALKHVHSQVLQNVEVRVDLAYHAFFQRVKRGVGRHSLEDHELEPWEPSRRRTWPARRHAAVASTIVRIVPGRWKHAHAAGCVCARRSVWHINRH